MNSQEMISNKKPAYKDIYTLPEAARYLAKLLGDEINVADVLELALKGELKLSVIIAKETLARCYPDEPKDEYINHPALGMIKNPKVGIFPIKGIFDLPMKGGEILDVQYEQQRFHGGLAEKHVNTGGTYIEDLGGQVYQLQERFEFQICKDLSEEEMSDLFPMSKELVNGIFDFNCSNNCFQKDDNLKCESVKPDVFNDMLGHSPKIKTLHAPCNCRPAGCLPDGSEFRVRKGALNKLVKDSSEKLEREIQLSKKEEKIVFAEEGIIDQGGDDSYKPRRKTDDTGNFFAPGEERLRSFGKIAEYLEVSSTTVRTKYKNIKGFPLLKLGGVYFSSPSRLDKWLASCKPEKKK